MDDAQQEELIGYWRAYTVRSDRAAFGRLFRRALPEVCRLVRYRHQKASEEDREDAVARAFEALARRPGAYDPSRKGLVEYLALIAERQLAGIVRTRYGRQPGPAAGAEGAEEEALERRRVALGDAGANNQREVGLDSLPETLPDGRSDTERDAILRALFAGADPKNDYRPEVRAWLEGTLRDPRDRNLLRLAADGPVCAEECARLYGLSDLSIEEKRLALKQNRDRVLRKVRRNRASLAALLHSLGDAPEITGAETIGGRKHDEH
jgi:DNA-directed RNA polymerase specialized sigma24 family protein